MAIVQSSLVEELLSRQEKAVIRGIYRASQLNDAKVILERIRESTALVRAPERDNVLASDITRLQEYLGRAIASALASTKSPASPPVTVIPTAKDENV